MDDIAEVAKEKGFTPSKDFQLRLGTFGAELAVSLAEEGKNVVL
jgi:phenylacetate-coenzyme A ligase PaaK-like adenylate-forming protein